MLPGSAWLSHLGGTVRGPVCPPPRCHAQDNPCSSLLCVPLLAAPPLFSQGGDQAGVEAQPAPSGALCSGGASPRGWLGPPLGAVGWQQCPVPVRLGSRSPVCSSLTHGGCRRPESPPRNSPVRHAEAAWRWAGAAVCN